MSSTKRAGLVTSDDPRQEALSDSSYGGGGNYLFLIQLI